MEQVREVPGNGNKTPAYDTEFGLIRNGKLPLFMQLRD